MRSHDGSGPAPAVRSPDGSGPATSSQPTTPDSYYGMSVLNPPVWEELEIAGYLFLGGLSGASAILASAAQLSGRERLAHRAQLTASASIGVSFLALIKDLGRPERFINMLRVFKPTSPMSVGTWILSAYAPLQFASTAATLTGRAPLAGRLAGLGAGLTGSLVATYTAALIADTAVPAWHDGHRELPFLFAGSAAMAAGGAGLALAPRAENGPAWRLALLGAGTELAAEALMERRLGMVVEALERGRAGERLRLAKRLALGGAALTAAVGRRSRLPAALGGSALVAASALTRFGLFAAGMDSAQDPRFTVEPQRRRLREQGIQS